MKPFANIYVILKQIAYVAHTRDVVQLPINSSRIKQQQRQQ